MLDGARLVYRSENCAKVDQSFPPTTLACLRVCVWYRFREKVKPMHAKSVLFAAIVAVSLCVASTGWTDVPAPPVNQTIGMLDVLIGELTEADCRVCHDSGVPDRHHLLYGHTHSSRLACPLSGCRRRRHPRHHLRMLELS